MRKYCSILINQRSYSPGLRIGSLVVRVVEVVPASILSQRIISSLCCLFPLIQSFTISSDTTCSTSSTNQVWQNQEYNKSKSDKGYHAVPPPYTRNFIPFKPDLTFMYEIVKSKNMDVTTIVIPSNVKKVESNHEFADVKNNRFRPPVIEDWNFDDDSEVEFIPNVEDKTVRPSTKKIKFVKSARETVKKVETPKQNKHYPRGNQSNWNNLISQKLGSDFKMFNKACFVCGSFEHLHYVCDKKVKDTTTRDRAAVSENKGKGVNAVKASACWIQVYNGLDPQKSLILLFYVHGNPHLKEYKEKWVIDSGCSRHMTGNKCCLTEYEDYDGGFVSFGDGKGRISGKRKDNIYSVDLKSVVPTKGLTCLFAKATIDESNLWHKRLGHINFKNINKLVRGNLVRCLPLKIFENDHSYVACQKGKQHKASYKAKLVNSIRKPLHMLHMDLFVHTNVKSLMKKSYCLVVTDDFKLENQLDHKVKVIRSYNGTEFKNSVMNPFCEMKGIKREFSVAWTPQQNGVAERKNRTLIEAARTIRTPLIDFMKPFGCPVTILNTRDHLGEFDGKANEGFFVGYSMLFDVNSLTKSMNYVLVVLENQTNGIAGTRDNIIVGQAKKKIEHEQEYILIHFCITDPLISQVPKDSEEGVSMKPIEVNESGASYKGEEDEQDTRSEFERLLQQEKQTNGTNCFNTIGTPVSAVGPSFTNDDPSSLVNAAEASNAFENHLLERVSHFKNAFSLPHVQMCFHIDDTGSFEPNKVIKALADLSWVEAMQEELLQFKLQKIWTLVDLQCKRQLEPNGIEVIGLFLAYASFMGFIVYQIDVKSAFLYGTIKEEVYVCQPPGFKDPQFPDKVYKVEKALYGLHQAPRAWCETLSTYLIENGFRRGTIDKTLFIKRDNGDILFDAQEIPDEFYGGTHFLLRIATSTLIETNKALVKDEEAEAVDVHLYGSMIGSLIYLKSQPKLGLWYPRDSPFDLKAFSDSDYAGASLDRKSTTGGCQFLGKRLISWQCKKQTIVANSTTMAEYVAAAN
ncbi:putative ribonuclease H-like domain-containing protein [Tanacetum coccineum]